MHMPSAAVRILIVDDHREMAENIVDILTEGLEGSELQCALTKDREQALERARSGDFDLAILDLHLPDGNGLELLRELRDLLPFVQVVVITGDATVESAIRALHEGAFGYVLKPFRAQQLIETASNAIERSHLLRDRERLSRELEDSERRNREVIDRVPALILALDESGKIAVWNRQLEAVTGYSREEMLGKDGIGVIDHENVVRLELKRGGHRSVRWRTAVVPQPNGREPLRYAVGQDVTDEREMQLRAIRAERLAAVGTLAAGLAHEVRNPLNSATLQLQLLERRLERGKIDQESLSGTLTIVKSEIERLDAMVSDFLAFAKPRPITTEPSDLNELVRGVVQLVNLEAKDAGVGLNTELDPSLGSVPVDAQSIKQVVLNLVRNAIEASGSGGNITLTTRPSNERACVVLEVLDDGPGFSDDAPVFDAFYTTKDRGTGLGLAIVHRIVSEHGGSIAVSSRPGHTCFTIELPQPALSQPPSSG